MPKPPTPALPHPPIDLNACLILFGSLPPMAAKYGTPLLEMVAYRGTEKRLEVYLSASYYSLEGHEKQRLCRICTIEPDHLFSRWLPKVCRALRKGLKPPLLQRSFWYDVTVTEKGTEYQALFSPPCT
jgi:hypothetical protein